MATIGSIVVAIRANTTKFVQGIEKSKNKLKDFANSISPVRLSLSALGASAATAGAAFIAWGVRLSSATQQAQLALETLTGSAADAAKMIQDVKRLAAATPFQQAELIQAAKGLTAFGDRGEVVIERMKMLGDAASVTGADINDLVQIYGKVQTRGRSTMEELNRLNERAINVQGELQKQLGITGQEFDKLVAAGGITRDVFNKAFAAMNKEGGVFFEGMQKQSTTLAGKWSTLKDSFGEAAEEISSNLVPALSSLAASLTTVQKVRRGFNEFIEQDIPNMFREMFPTGADKPRRFPRNGNAAAAVAAAPAPQRRQPLGLPPGLFLRGYTPRGTSFQSNQSMIGNLMSMMELQLRAGVSLLNKQKEVFSEPALAGAFEKGSTEAMQLIARNQGKSRSDPSRMILEENKKQTDRLGDVATGVNVIAERLGTVVSF